PRRGRAVGRAPPGLYVPVQHVLDVLFLPLDPWRLEGAEGARAQRRLPFHFSLRAGLAARLEGTICACRSRPSTDTCTQIHQRLGVALDVLLGHLRLGELPQAILDPFLSGVAAHREMTREHPLDISVEDR